MKQIQGILPLNKTWKIVITTEAAEDEDYEWVIAALKRGEDSFSLDALRYRGNGDVINIVDPRDSYIDALLQELDKFEKKWQMNALELGLPFEVDDRVTEWAKDVAPSCTAQVV